MAHAHNHYNLNELRAFPLSDAATTVDNTGKFLPHDILVDCRLRFPRDVAQYAFVGGITVTPRLVSLVILGTTSQDETSGYVPLASLTVTKPLEVFRPYAVTPLYPGVGGWVVFGSGTATSFVGRFATPAQSLLAPRAATPYQGLPVKSIGKLGLATALTGLVTIVGGTDIEVTVDTVLLGSELRKALILSLKADTPGENVLQKYLTECGGRPESGTCDKPGIEFVNGVPPDCDGNLEITFVNLEEAPYESCAGVVLDHGVELEETCVNKQPFVEPVDLCEDQSSDSSLSASSDIPDTSSESSLVPSSESESCAALPVVLNFDTPAGQFVIKNGDFEYQAYDSPSEIGGGMGTGALTAINPSTRNIGIWDNCGASPALDRIVTTDVQVTALAPSRNGGLVLNYHLADPLENPHIEYFLVLLDLNVNKIRVLRYNGLNHVEEYASPTPLPFVPNDWYRIEAEITTLSVTQKAIAVTVSGISDPGFGPVSFSLATTRYGDPTDGRFGVGSLRGYARFSFLQIEDSP